MIVTNLLTNMVVVTLGGAIQTNSPAFQEYAYQLLLTNSLGLSRKLRLDPSLMSTGRVSGFSAKPCLTGPTASMKFGDRYIFAIEEGVSFGFSDSAYFRESIFDTTGKVPDDASAHIARTYNELLGATNSLNRSKAQNLAESALSIFGVPSRLLPEFKRPASAEQLKHDPPDAIKRPGAGSGGFLPYYVFSWENDEPYASCEVHVSGITSNIVFFSYSGPPIDLPKPTNYFQLLGYPPNPIFVRRSLTSPGHFETFEPGAEDPH
jgi:hypothetical protein